MIHQVQKGEKIISSPFTPKIIKAYYALVQRKPELEKLELQPPTHLLTKREIETLKYLAEGMSNPEIATAMNISDKTVKNHIINMFQKVQVNSRTKLIATALKNRWITVL